MGLDNGRHPEWMEATSHRLEQDRFPSRRTHSRSQKDTFLQHKRLRIRQRYRIFNDEMLVLRHERQGLINKLKLTRPRPWRDQKINKGSSILYYESSILSRTAEVGSFYLSQQG